MQFLMILNDPGIAHYACAHNGIVPFVDMEYKGKDVRQKGMDTVKSAHTYADVTRIREAVPEAHLLVRINPLDEDTSAEIEEVIARGADGIMLPMFREIDELARFLDLLKGRVTARPLFETARAVALIPRMIERLELRMLHIGLNDLALDLRLPFMFQPLAMGLLEEPAAAMREAGVMFGIGGLARADEGIVSPRHLLGEHVRLGSQAAILSRSFHRSPTSVEQMRANMDFAAELAQLRAIHAAFSAQGPEALAQNRQLTWDKIADVAQLIEKHRNREGRPT
jgi:hypothetical protein